MVKQITTRPPIIPPTTAPTFIEDEEEEGNKEVEDGQEDERVEPDGGDVIEEYTVELELDAGKVDVSTTVFVDRKDALFAGLLGTEVKLDGVVVVSATVVLTKSVSIRASGPQLMYS